MHGALRGHAVVGLRGDHRFARRKGHDQSLFGDVGHRGIVRGIAQGAVVDAGTRGLAVEEDSIQIFIVYIQRRLIVVQLNAGYRLGGDGNFERSRLAVEGLGRNRCV